MKERHNSKLRSGLTFSNEVPALKSDQESNFISMASKFGLAKILEMNQS